MPLLRQPTRESLEQFRESQRGLALTYAAVGATTDAQPPPGYRRSRTRVRLGEGEAAFEAAQAALRSWRQLQVGWIKCHPDVSDIEEGATVVIVARSMGVYWLNAARIVDVEDETAGRRRRFGFAYGTLPGHSVSGEERFRCRDRPRGHGVVRAECHFTPSPLVHVAGAALAAMAASAIPQAVARRHATGSPAVDT